MICAAEGHARGTRADGGARATGGGVRQRRMHLVQIHVLRVAVCLQLLVYK